MEEELLDVRKDKVQRLRELGVNPYPYRYERQHTSRQLIDHFESLGISDDSRLNDPDVPRVQVCGRRH